MRSATIVLALGAAGLGGLVVATAENAPPSAGRSAVHLVTVVTPIHGQAHRNTGNHGNGSGGSTSAGSVQLLGSASRQAQVQGPPQRSQGSTASSSSTAAGGLGDGSGTSPAAGATTETLHTFVTAVAPRTGGHATTTRAATSRGIAAANAGSGVHHAADVLVIPPAALPAPSLLRPSHTGFAAGPLVALLSSVVLLGALLGLRLARQRPT